MVSADKRGPGRSLPLAASLGKWYQILPATLLFLLGTPFLPGREPLQASPDKELSFYYKLQGYLLNPQDQKRLLRFAQNASAQSYYLVEGYACEQGGYDASYRVARLRAQNVARLLQSGGAAGNSIRRSEVVVLYGTPYAPHRRVRVRRFASAAQLESSFQEASAKARQLNQDTRRQLGLPPIEAGNEEKRATHKEEQESELKQSELKQSELKQSRDAGVASKIGLDKKEPPESLAPEEPNRQEGIGPTIKGIELWPLILGLIIATGIALLLYRGGAFRSLKKRRHTIAKEEALKSAVAPVGDIILPPDEKVPFRGIGDISQLLEKTRSETFMASKKLPIKKATPLSIESALDPDFADKSLKELCRAPVHALLGLTPRHGRLLEEAFGISNVEDLARLKYVEIAKAITVLAQYEKN